MSGLTWFCRLCTEIIYSAVPGKKEVHPVAVWEGAHFSNENTKRTRVRYEMRGSA